MEYYKTFKVWFMNNFAQMQNLSTYNKTYTIDEINAMSMFRKQSHKAEVGDEILFPQFEDLVWKTQGSIIFDEGSSEERRYKYIYVTVIRNGRKDWLLVKTICQYTHKPETCTYDLIKHFNYLLSNDMYELLKFLGDLECPVTITKTGISW